MRLNLKNCTIAKNEFSTRDKPSLFAIIIKSTYGQKFIIPILKKLKVGQSEREDGPRSHLKKQGTPTMGGIMMMLTMIIFTTVSCLLNKESEFVRPVLMISIASLGFGLVGFIDDFKKVVLHNTEGLNPKLKMLGLLIVASIYTIFLTEYTNINTELILPFTDYKLNLPTWIFIPFTILVMLSATNAVNLTDGVDGLAASVCAIMLTAISIIAIKLDCTEVSVLGSIIVGSCLGFLVYNFHKAKVMMGDTGSLLLRWSYFKYGNLFTNTTFFIDYCHHTNC